MKYLIDKTVDIKSLVNMVLKVYYPFIYDILGMICTFSCHEMFRETKLNKSHFRK